MHIEWGDVDMGPGGHKIRNASKIKKPPRDNGTALAKTDTPG